MEPRPHRMEVGSQLLTAVATRDLPAQVSAIESIRQRLMAFILPAHAYGQVSGSRAAAAGHAQFLDQTEYQFDQADELLNTTIAGLKLVTASMERYDAKQRLRAQEQGPDGAGADSRGYPEWR